MMEEGSKGSDVVLGSMRGPSQVDLAHRDLGRRERTDIGGLLAVACCWLLPQPPFAARGSD